MIRRSLADLRSRLLKLLFGIWSSVRGMLLVEWNGHWCFVD